MIRRSDRFDDGSEDRAVSLPQAEAKQRMGALREVLAEMTVPGELYEQLPDGKLHCYACGHECAIPEGKWGVCRVRYNDAGQLRVPHGYVGALACDPIEKKPFFHAFPSRDVVSFGMLGCDMRCGYCQNWVTSQALKDPNAISDAQQVTPDQLADLAVRYNAPVLATTYNEPLITSEWAVDVMTAAHQRGCVGAYISNGNATRRVLEYIQPWVQLYKVDLKSFQDREYRKLGGIFEHVKRTIRELHELGFWLEIVTLIVPGLNDSDAEISEMADFLVNISPDIPWHLTGFHSDYKMDDVGDTPVERLVSACEIGQRAGLRYVYAGNRPGRVGEHEHTRCPQCRSVVIERLGFHVLNNRLHEGHCPDCGQPIPGFWSNDCVIPQENMGEPRWLRRATVGQE